MTQNGLAKRNEKGHFLPGQTAAPAGKSRRKRVPRALLDAAVSDEDLQRLIELGLQKAKDGDDQWAGFFLQRYLPQIKAQSPKIVFELDTSSPAAAIEDVLDAISSGTLSTDHGKDLIASIGTLAQVAEIEDIKLQIAELSALLGQTP